MSSSSQLGRISASEAAKKLSAEILVELSQEDSVSNFLGFRELSWEWIGVEYENDVCNIFYYRSDACSSGLSCKALFGHGAQVLYW